MLLKQLLRHGVWKVRGRATGLHPKPGPEKPLTMARLPPACRAVLAEPQLGAHVLGRRAGEPVTATATAGAGRRACPGNNVGLQFSRLSDGLRITGLADDHHALWQTIRRKEDYRHAFIRRRATRE
jgi:hypothetical protein